MKASKEGRTSTANTITSMAGRLQLIDLLQKTIIYPCPMSHPYQFNKGVLLSSSGKQNKIKTNKQTNNKKKKTK